MRGADHAPDRHHLHRLLRARARPADHRAVRAAAAASSAPWSASWAARPPCPGSSSPRHIVRSQPAARVLMVNLELCTIHLQETSDLQSVLSFLIFADGCAASLISAEPVGPRDPRLRRARAARQPRPDHLAYRRQRLPDVARRRRPGHHRPRPAAARGRTCSAAARPGEVELWAVHPGGRSVLDAAQEGLRLDDGALDDSRAVLRDYGNM